MIDGRYRLAVKTPMGKRPGSAVLRTRGDKVTGEIVAPVIGRQHLKGQLDGDNAFDSEGSFWLMFVGRIRYTLHVEVEGDAIHVLINSSKGNFDIRGKRVA